MIYLFFYYILPMGLCVIGCTYFKKYLEDYPEELLWIACLLPIYNALLALIFIAAALVLLEQNFVILYVRVRVKYLEWKNKKNR